MHKNLLFVLNSAASVAAGSLGFASPVAAQDTFVLEEIIVSAQKRSQNLQDVPMAVSAISGKLAERFNFKDSNDLARSVPGLNIALPTGPGNQPAIFLRGIGLNDFSANNAGPIGVYIDDLFVSSPSAQVFQIVNGGAKLVH